MSAADTYTHNASKNKGSEGVCEGVFRSISEEMQGHCYHKGETLGLLKFPLCFAPFYGKLLGTARLQLHRAGRRQSHGRVVSGAERRSSETE